ncbi:MAG: hypothetical protein D6808_07015, partial [Candidatus Dadabacteria bacterium]
ALDVVVATLSGEILTGYSFYASSGSKGLLQLKDRIEAIREKLANLNRCMTEAEKERQDILESVREAEDLYSAALRDTERLAGRVRDLSQQRGTVLGRLSAEKKALEQIRQDAEKLSFKYREVTSRIERLSGEEVELSARMANDLPQDEVELKKEADEIEEKVNEIESRRKKGRLALSDKSKEVAELRGRLDKVRGELSRVDLDRQKVALSITHLKEFAGAEVGGDFLIHLNKMEESIKAGDDEGFVLLDENEKNSIKEEIEKLTRRIEREGEVDYTSIERYEEEAARLKDLEEQRRDLREAYETLKRTVEYLREVSLERFMETFNRVNENFGRLIPKLFGGGSGKLELLDPDNPLESGVEIIARPPGKKLKSIELLSGGEKSLCAIALIISMFLVRPSPLCVLDEVDAPLDDANVERFLSVIKELSTKTQFLLITHNKHTMSVCSSLVGVTMEEAGASKVVSVSLEEAYSHAVNV